MCIRDRLISIFKVSINPSSTSFTTPRGAMPVSYTHLDVYKRQTFISAQTQDSMYEKKLHFKQDIDVRGMRGDAALQAVTYFIDDAILVGMSRVRILHGTGTGIPVSYTHLNKKRTPPKGDSGYKTQENEKIQIYLVGVI